MESIADKNEIVLRPLDKRLTTAAFFRVYEHILETRGGTMKEAYSLAVDYCISHELSLCFSDESSFKRSYYRKIREMNSRRH